MADVNVRVRVRGTSDVRRAISGQNAELEKQERKRQRSTEQTAGVQEQTARRLIRLLRSLRSQEVREFEDQEKRKQRAIRGTAREQQQNARTLQRESRRARQSQANGGMGGRLGAMGLSSLAGLGTAVVGAVGAREIAQAAGAGAESTGGAIRSVGGIRSSGEAQASALRARQSLRFALSESIGADSPEFEAKFEEAMTSISETAVRTGIDLEKLATTIQSQQVLFSNFEQAVVAAESTAMAAQGTGEEFDQLATLVSQVAGSFRFTNDEVERLPGTLRKLGVEGSVSPGVFLDNFSQSITPFLAANEGRDVGGLELFQELLALSQLSVRTQETNPAEAGTGLRAAIRSITNSQVQGRLAQQGVQVREARTPEEQAAFERLATRGRNGDARRILRLDEVQSLPTGDFVGMTGLLERLDSAGVNTPEKLGQVFGDQTAANAVSILMNQRNAPGRTSLNELVDPSLQMEGARELTSTFDLLSSDPIFKAQQAGARQQVNALSEFEAQNQDGTAVRVEGILAQMEVLAPGLASIMGVIPEGLKREGIRRVLPAVDALKENRQGGDVLNFGRGLLGAGANALGGGNETVGGGILKAMEAIFLGRSQQGFLIDSAKPLRVEVINQVTVADPSLREGGAE